MDALPQQAEIALWTFSSKTKFNQDFTKDRNLLKQSIEQAEHLMGSTNLAESYTLAQKVFVGQEKTSAIIVVTDGVPDDLNAAIAAKPRVTLLPVYVWASHR